MKALYLKAESVSGTPEHGNVWFGLRKNGKEIFLCWLMFLKNIGLGCFFSCIHDAFCYELPNQ